MLAIDTNVIVRYLIADDPKQSLRAQALINGEDVFVSTTVLVETEWVLRYVYRLDTPALVHSLRSFAGLPRLTFEDPVRVAQAIDWMDEGLEFADALHLAGAEGCEAFVTFDRGLTRKANRLGTLEVRAP